MRTRAAAVAGLLLSLSVMAAPGGGATRDVSLTADGPVPRSLTLKAGDRVQFFNNDSVPHQVASQSGWQYNSGPIPPGRVSPETPPLTAPGTYVYDDVRGLLIVFQGRLVVPKAAPSPSPTKAAPTQSPTPSPTPSRTPTAAPSPTPVTTPTPPATPTPTPTASPTVAPASPTPTVAPPTTPPPSAAPVIHYGAQEALVQASPHRYGLPALIALVLIVGVASLLLRYLLFLAPAARDEAGPPRW